MACTESVRLFGSPISGDFPTRNFASHCGDGVRSINFRNTNRNEQQNSIYVLVKPDAAGPQIGSDRTHVGADPEVESVHTSSLDRVLC
jgi:hypothetical protein